MRPTSAMAAATVEVREPACRVWTNSEAVTAPSFREPATRKSSSQFSWMRSTLILLREMPKWKGIALPL